MGYKSEHLMREIREAREASGMSQRALSARTGQTQSHISQIESGKMEPGMATFIDMARALGLEAMLVPRKLVPGVRALVRSQQALDAPARAGQKEDRRFARALRLVKKIRILHGSSAHLDRVEDLLRDLRRMGLGDQEVEVIAAQIDMLEREQGGAEGAAMLRNVSRVLQRLRNSIANSTPSEPKAAYTLDDERSDA